MYWSSLGTYMYVCVHLPQVHWLGPGGERAGGEHGPAGQEQRHLPGAVQWEDLPAPGARRGHHEKVSAATEYSNRVQYSTQSIVHALWHNFINFVSSLTCDSILARLKGWFTIWRWALRCIASILGQVGRLCPKSTSLGRKQECYVGYAGIEFGSIPAALRCVSTAFQRGTTRRDAVPSVILWTSHYTK